MKKILVLVGLFCIAWSLKSQSFESKKIIEERFGMIDCEYSKLISLPSKKASYSVNLSFKNLEYKQLVDMRSISIKSKIDLKKFISDLKEAKDAVLEEGEKKDWIGKNYLLSRTHGEYNDVYVFDSKLGITFIGGLNLSDLIKFLSQIDFGKDALLP